VGTENDNWYDESRDPAKQFHLDAREPTHVHRRQGGAYTLVRGTREGCSECTPHATGALVREGDIPLERRASRGA
jgi:hypothetical protein